MRSRKSPLFEIRSSPIAGSGAFALRPIPAFTRLIEYTGERVSHEVADARYEEDEANGNTHTVLFTVNDRTVIDAGVGGNEARFFNHACDPNCQSIIVRGRVYLETIRDIAAGEELTYDYEIPREGEDDETARRKWPCHCGAANCRGTLLLPLPKKAAGRKTAGRGRRKQKRTTPARGSGAPVIHKTHARTAVTRRGKRNPRGPVRS
jgi:SET domain-containing protein